MKRYESVYKFIIRIESFHGSKSSFKVFMTRKDAIDFATKLIKKELNPSTRTAQQIDFIDQTIKDKRQQSVVLFDGTTSIVNKDFIKV